jgi:UDP-glucose 4-epimerase
VITWTIGAGGLLGSAIARRLAKEHDTFAGAQVPWASPAAAQRILANDVRRFAEVAGTRDWAIIWAAGAATVATSAQQAEAELQALQSVLSALRSHPPAGRGVFFLSSSAGGVYAGSTNPPFTEATPIRPLSAYGELKAEQEAAARAALEGADFTLVIGRFSNLYGPGQDLGKVQGLISQLALASATRQPINIFVSLDTIRDYIYVDDAADLAAQWIQAGLGEDEKSTQASQTRIIASGQPVALGQLIRTMQSITKRRVPVALGSHPSAKHQVLDLRLTPSPPASTQTPLPVGTKRVYDDILRRLQRSKGH